MSDKMNLNSKTVTREKGHYITIKESNDTITNISRTRKNIN